VKDGGFITRNRRIILGLIVLLGLGLRLNGLGSIGFNEDEINKVEAARAYLHGDFSKNLEHPMLMKSMIAVSIGASRWWNHHQGRLHSIPEEVSVRLPNVVFGALTSIVLFLIAQGFFGVEVGLLSALLWASGILEISINRIAKEDTLLVFFTWLAYYFYVRAKHSASADRRIAQKYYAASGASFGLMLASKYFPIYLGLVFLYFWLFGKKLNDKPCRQRDMVLLFGSLGLVFLAANPTVLLPSTWKYMLHYVQNNAIASHSYLMMGHYYHEDLGHFGNGMPFYFYWLFLAIKTPIPALAVFLVGLVGVIRRRREAGASFILFMFLLWIIPFSILSAKWLRYMLSWMPTVTIMSAIGGWRAFLWLAARTKLQWRPAVAGVTIAGFVATLLAGPLWTAMKAGPFYSLYVNALVHEPPAYFFPHDELNDNGLRAAIEQICSEAPRGAMVGGESQAVSNLFNYYFHRYGRDDLRYFVMTNQTRVSTTVDPYFVVSSGREYPDNASFVHTLESTLHPAWTVEVGGIRAAEVFHTQELAQLVASR
jgi:Dolichyl-phosphate-mannose-protein mannosyltransferase